MANGCYRRPEIYGMHRFNTWYVREGKPRGITPTDVDGLIHNGLNNGFFAIEFKPADSEVSVGQDILLKGFSKLPHSMAVAVFDPHSEETLPEGFRVATSFRAYIYRDGNRRPPKGGDTLTAAELNELIDWWFEHG